MSPLALFCEALPFMTAMSPVIGVVSVAIAARWNAALVKPMALSNAGLTLLLACAVVLNYDPQQLDRRGRADVAQMEVHLHWLTEVQPATSTNEPPLIKGLNVRQAFGVDGLTLWPLVWISLATWTALWFPCVRAHTSPAAYYIGLLIAEASLLASCTSRDAISSLVFFQTSIPALGFLIGKYGQDVRRDAAVRFLNYLFVACGLMLLGTTLIAVSWPWMQSDLASRHNSLSFGLSNLVDHIQVILTRSEVAVQLWGEVSPWALLLLATGFAVCLPIFPFSRLYGQTLSAAPAGVAGLLAIALPQAALCGWIRFVQPLFTTEMVELSMMLGVMGSLSVLYYALITVSQNDLKRFVVAMSMAWICLAFLGLRLPVREGLVGAWLLVQSQGLAVTAMLLFVEMLNAHSGSANVVSRRWLLRQQPRLASMLVALMAGSGAICLNVAAGSILILSTVAKENLLFATCGITAVLLLSWASIANAQKLLFGSEWRVSDDGSVQVAETQPLPTIARPQSLTQPLELENPNDLTWSECFGFAPLLMALVVLVFTPGVVVQRANPTLTHLLERTERQTTPPDETNTRPLEGALH